jgi:hypothetical protein
VFAKFQNQEDWKAFYYSRTGILPSTFSHVDVVLDMSCLRFYLIRVNHGEETQQGSTEAHEEGERSQ